jgi:hypothetical protein
MYPDAWSPDGRVLVFQERRPATGWDLRVLESNGDEAPGAARDLVATPFDEANAAVSPDGRLVAYESDELDGINGIYVAPLAKPEARVRVAVAGPRWPRWGPREQLFYWHPPRARPGESPAAAGLQRIDWTEDAARRALAKTVPLWGETSRGRVPTGRLRVASYAGYDVDVSAREPRFLFLESAVASEDEPLAQPVVVLNWVESLRASLERR